MVIESLESLLGNLIGLQGFELLASGCLLLVSILLLIKVSK